MSLPKPELSNSGPLGFRFHDGFNRTEIGSEWLTEGNWKVENGVLVPVSGWSPTLVLNKQYNSVIKLKTIIIPQQYQETFWSPRILLGLPTPSLMIELASNRVVVYGFNGETIKEVATEIIEFNPITVKIIAFGSRLFVSVSGVQKIVVKTSFPVGNIGLRSSGFSLHKFESITILGF